MGGTRAVVTVRRASGDVCYINTDDMAKVYLLQIATSEGDGGLSTKTAIQVDAAIADRAEAVADDLSLQYNVGARFGKGCSSGSQAYRLLQKAGDASANAARQVTRRSGRCKHDFGGTVLGSAALGLAVGGQGRQRTLFEFFTASGASESGCSDDHSGTLDQFYIGEGIDAEVQTRFEHEDGEPLGGLLLAGRALGTAENPSEKPVDDGSGNGGSSSRGGSSSVQGSYVEEGSGRNFAECAGPEPLLSCGKDSKTHQGIGGSRDNGNSGGNSSAQGYHVDEGGGRADAVCAEGQEDEANSQLVFDVGSVEMCAWDAATLHRKQYLHHDVWANWVVDTQLARERRAKQWKQKQPSVMCSSDS